MKKKNLVIILLIVFIIIAAIVVITYWKSQKNGELEGNSYDVPKLFGKEDYKIEERQDGKYVVIDKIGFSAKAPDGWRVEYEKTPSLNDEFIISMYSPDHEGGSYTKKGCGISITVGSSDEYYQDIKDEILRIKNNEPVQSQRMVNLIENKIKEISQKEVIFWLSEVHPVAGQFTGITTIFDTDIVLDVSASFADKFQEQCLPVWEEFYQSIQFK
jgi:hypothetical protein